MTARRLLAAAAGGAAAAWWRPLAAAAEPEKSSKRRSKGVRCVIVGGGCAGAICARKLEDWLDIVLIDRKPYLEFTPALTHLLLGKPLDPARIDDEAMQQWLKHYYIPHRFYLEHSRIIVDEAREVSPSEVVLRSGQRIPFDICILAMGGQYSPCFRQTAAKTVRDRALEAAQFTEQLSKCRSVAVVGGAAGGVEFAAELSTEHPDMKVVLIHPRQRLLDRHSAKVGHYAQRRLRRNGVDLRLLHRADKVELVPGAPDGEGRFKVRLLPTDADGKPVPDAERLGEEIRVDYVLNCTGLRPHTQILKKHFAKNLTRKGFVAVNDYGQLYGHPGIFAVGDCALPPGPNGDTKTLAHHIDQCNVVTDNLLNISLEQAMDKGNGVNWLPYPMQMIKLGGGSNDAVGTMQMAGQVKGWMAMYTYRKLFPSFLQPFQEPQFNVHQVTGQQVSVLLDWLQTATTRKGDYTHKMT
eukprot:TRINITY_DN71658_c0_g1_i1.p1 TRINITY_DN71658_c0_g1~~TRINITY_DN71658_c0_g1_i1.p1  ORF type:complete len:489 (+),score=158.91 TRINITY_DN71658_c0_g1_i1:69-1469(+)